MKNQKLAALGLNVLFYEKIDSTNSELKRLADRGALEGTLVLAQEQEAGRGRRGRSWVTPPGSAVAMSLLLRPEIAPEHASMITLVMGLAVARACRQLYQLDAQIKWPNDIVVNGKKICGILTEMKCEGTQIDHVIVGVGINTSVQAFPAELEKTADSLHRLIEKKPDQEELIACCMREFERCYEQFLQTEDLSALTDEYNEILAGRGDSVRVLEPGNEYIGISEGINAAGELQVRRENGTLESVYAGEVSVRGICGYV